MTKLTKKDVEELGKRGWNSFPIGEKFVQLSRLVEARNALKKEAHSALDICEDVEKGDFQFVNANDELWVSWDDVQEFLLGEKE